MLIENPEPAKSRGFTRRSWDFSITIVCAKACQGRSLFFSPLLSEARLRLATERLEEAQRERIWAVVEAHQSGLSIRQIAAATRLSSSRVHQLLGSDEAREIPRWLSQRRDQGSAPPKGHPDLRARLAG